MPKVIKVASNFLSRFQKKRENEQEFISYKEVCSFLIFDIPIAAPRIAQHKRMQISLGELIAAPELCGSTIRLFYIYTILLFFFFFVLQKFFFFFTSNQGQASALKVAYIFKVCGAQSCLWVSQWYDQVTYVCEERNNFQDSKSIFIILILKFPQ